MEHHFQRHYQPQPQARSQSKSFRNIHPVDFDGKVSQPASYFNPTDLHHPPFRVVGLAPSAEGADLQWDLGLEQQEKKRLKEQDFLENISSQISCVDLGLSLHNTRVASTGDFSLLSLDIDRQLLQQDAEIDRFLRVQNKRLRETILEKVQAAQHQSISFIEDRVLLKLREKDAEVESINKRNVELEERMQQLTVEADVWQQRARYNENLIAALKFNLQQVHAQSRDSKEGCGDSEVDDTASCFNGRSVDFNFLSTENNDMKEIMTCKACGVKEVTMLLLPCKHLCLCKDCESKLSFCPQCQSSKFIGMEVYM